MLGDIILAHGTCKAEAADKGVPFESHATHLIVHGTLHLLGYDHIDERDAADMEAREVRALERLGIADKLKKKMEADYWFEQGLELEQTGAPYEQIIAAYQKSVDLDPSSAGALVNLGTVLFNGHAWADAEAHYKKALQIDPNYALAHFNLGNLYDEQGDSTSALEHYRAAIDLHPNYADAHYNLALLHQGLQDSLGAMRHWRAYLKLDVTSNWAQIAKRELTKLESSTVLRGSRLTLVKGEKS